MHDTWPFKMYSIKVQIDGKNDYFTTEAPVRWTPEEAMKAMEDIAGTIDQKIMMVGRERVSSLRLYCRTECGRPFGVCSSKWPALRNVSLIPAPVLAESHITITLVVEKDAG